MVMKVLKPVWLSLKPNRVLMESPKPLNKERLQC